MQRTAQVTRLSQTPALLVNLKKTVFVIVRFFTERILVSEFHMGVLAILVVDGAMAPEMDSHTILMVAFNKGLCRTM